MMLAIITQTYYDYLSPFIDLVFGINDAKNAMGSDSYKFDLRYSQLQKYPLETLCKELALAFINDSEEKMKLARMSWRGIISPS